MRNTARGVLEDVWLDGIEAYHSKHTPGQVSAFVQVAEDRGLLVSGGSDCHGSPTAREEMGRVRLPWERYERIIEALGRA
jgi:hypothetical protein